MKRALLIAYLIAIHAALATALWRSGLPDRVGLRKSDHPHIVTMRVVLDWRDATTPSGAAIFLGDSLTERLAVTAVEPEAVNFGVSWQRSDQLIIPDAARTASRIYLLIGTNDFLQGRSKDIVPRLERISETLPEVPLIWTGVMLPDAHWANVEIRRICSTRPRCTYVEPMAGEDSFVDGVHLSESGYAQWIDALRAAR